MESYNNKVPEWSLNRRADPEVRGSPPHSAEQPRRRKEYADCCQVSVGVQRDLTMKNETWAATNENAENPETDTNISELQLVIVFNYSINYVNIANF